VRQGSGHEGTPYAVVSAAERIRPVSKAELVGISRTLEQRAFGDPPLAALAALQDERFLTRRTRSVYRRLADAGSSVTLHARGLQSWLGRGVRGIALDDQDPLVDEWVIVLLSPQRPAVLAAVDLRHPYAADVDRSFQYAVSHDAEVAAACARLLGYQGDPLRG